MRSFISLQPSPQSRLASTPIASSMARGNASSSATRSTTLPGLPSSEVVLSPVFVDCSVPVGTPANAEYHVSAVSSIPGETSTPAAQCSPHGTPNELEAENVGLRLQIAKLQKEYRSILDHSIESDTRLMQFTDQVFVASTSKTLSNPRDGRIDFAVQCELGTTDCQDPRCVDTQDLVSRLRSTIEVLEADNACLRAEVEKCGCHHRLTTESWTVFHKNKQTPIETHNRFDLLNSVLDDVGNINVKTKQEGQKSKRRPQRKTINRTDHQQDHAYSEENHATKSLVFKTVIIEGDSHGRDLARLVQQRVAATTRVSGICKPAAKLLDVTSGTPPPPGSCCVLIAGTNDIAAGEPQNIYRHLEERVTDRLSSARVILSTIPYRHDLPADHLVNRQTSALNMYIEELCSRSEGVELLNINNIGRRWFTRHGMHLRLPGKRILAEQIVKCMEKAGKLAAYKPSLHSSPNCLLAPSPPPLLVTLSSANTPCAHHDPIATSSIEGRDVTPQRPTTPPVETYADAVTGTLTQYTKNSGPSPDKKNSNISPFIEKD